MEIKINLEVGLTKETQDVIKRFADMFCAGCLVHGDPVKAGELVDAIKEDHAAGLQDIAEEAEELEKSRLADEEQPSLAELTKLKDQLLQEEVSPAAIKGVYSSFGISRISEIDQSRRAELQRSLRDLSRR